MPRTTIRSAFSLLAILVATPLDAATPEQCADADLSGSRTVTDGVLVLRSAAELAGGCSVASRCDIDGNGAITVTDGVAALRLAAGLAVAANCPNTNLDLSAFRNFALGSGLSFGYCPQLGAPARVILTTNDDGILLDAAVVVEGAPGDPDCIPDAMPVPPVACAKLQTLPARVLNAEETTRVRNTFATIAIEQQRNPDCGRVPVEPCLVNNFSWDDYLITDFACGEPRLAPDQAAAVVALLDSLL